MHLNSETAGDVHLGESGVFKAGTLRLTPIKSKEFNLIKKEILQRFLNL